MANSVLTFFEDLLKKFEGNPAITEPLQQAKANAEAMLQPAIDTAVNAVLDAVHASSLEPMADEIINGVIAMLESKLSANKPPATPAP